VARYSGYIGVKNDPVEVRPGVFTQDISEIEVSGQLKPKPWRWSAGELAQDKATAGHIISIIAPESTIGDWGEVLYATWQGRKWAVKSVEYARPRINLTLGGYYNGK
jgi:hypothetical protein